LKKLLLDQGIPYSTASHFALPSWEVQHVSDLGMSRATDMDIIDHARAHRQACVTLDADFHTLLALRGLSLPSVVRVRQEGLRGIEMAKLLERVAVQIEKHLSAGVLATVTEDCIRLRHLPINRGL